MRSHRNIAQYRPVIPEVFGVPLDTRYVPVLSQSRDPYLTLSTAIPTLNQVRCTPALEYPCSHQHRPFSDWEIWTAGIVTDTNTRDLFISSVRRYASNGLNSQPLGDWYQTVSGEAEGFRARPVAGGHLALVSLSFFAFLKSPGLGRPQLLL
jgi:hypothetical protein